LHDGLSLNGGFDWQALHGVRFQGMESRGARERKFKRLWQSWRRLRIELHPVPSDSKDIRAAKTISLFIELHSLLAINNRGCGSRQLYIGLNVVQTQRLLFFDIHPS